MKCDANDEIVSFEDIADLLDDSHSPTLIVLSACETKVHARHFASRFASVLSWRGEFDDAYAATFSFGFYGALAHGNALGQAIEQAHNDVKGRWPHVKKPDLLGSSDPVFPRYGQ